MTSDSSRFQSDLLMLRATFSSEVTLYSYAVSWSIVFTDLSYIVLGKILDSGVRVYTCAFARMSVSCLSAYSVDICETDLNTLFLRQVDTSNTSHYLICTSIKFGLLSPDVCLCLGFWQITITLPFLLITLHFSQIGLTEGLTFIEIPPLNLATRIKNS